MKNKYLLIIGILAFTACKKEDTNFDTSIYNCNTSITNTHPKSSKFQDFINQKVAEGLPGISMLISTPDGIWTGAAGVAEIPFQTPMKSCNVHKIGSSSKPFSATFIFQLYEQGLLGLDDLITKHLDNSLICRVANYNTVTIKNLLNHTSGIPNYLDIAYTLNYYDDITRLWTDKEELSMIYGMDADFQVGEKIAYSNTNYLLLGMIAKKLTNKNGTQLHQENIFNKIGIYNTFFSEKGDFPNTLVRGYSEEDGNGNFIDITDRSYARTSFAGGVSSTVEDLYLFVKSTWTSNVLISDSTRKLIKSLNNIPTPDWFEYGGADIVNRIKGIGLGWFIYDTDYGICYGHDGGLDGRRSVMKYFPATDTYFIYLVNGSGTSLKSTLTRMRRNDVYALVFE